MEIKVKNKKIKENIIDENGNILMEVSFNPDDLNVYNMFISLTDDIEKTYQKDKTIGDVNITKKELENIEEFEGIKGELNKVKNKLSNADELFITICKKMDSIFGEGTSMALTDGENDIELFYPLIEWASPYFKKKRKAKVDKYLKDDSDVM